VNELSSVNVDIVLYPLSAFRAMNKAAELTYRTLRTEGSQQSIIGTMQTRKELYDSIGYWDFERKLDELFAKSK
jgi:methylisocitrate lyase